MPHLLRAGGAFLFSRPEAMMVMMSRVRGYADEPEERARAPDYWLVRTASVYYFVSADVAAQILKQLGRRIWRPRWLRFVDLSGARIAVPTRSVLEVGEATAAQRAFDRALMKALAEEAEEPRPWE
jgi:hypothetical protein